MSRDEGRKRIDEEDPCVTVHQRSNFPPSVVISKCSVLSCAKDPLRLFPISICCPQ